MGFLLFFLLLLGKLSVGQWASSMEVVLDLNLPWRSLSFHLVTRDKDGNIDYMSSFQDIRIKNPVKEASGTAAAEISWSQTPFGPCIRVT